MHSLMLMVENACCSKVERLGFLSIDFYSHEQIDCQSTLHPILQVLLAFKHTNTFALHNRFTTLGLPFKEPIGQILTNSSLVFVFIHPDLVRKL